MIIAPPSERLLTLLTLGRLRAGLAAHGSYLYASTADSIFRWAYVDGARSALPPDSAELVVHSVGRESSSRGMCKLAVDGNGMLYVSVAPAGGHEEGSVRRFETDGVSSDGVAFSSG